MSDQTPTSGGRPEGPEMPDDAELRRLLQDAVSDVEPAGGLDAIFAHTSKVTPLRRRWLPVTLAAAVATAAVIGGVVVLNQRDDPAATPAASPGRSSTSPASATNGDRTVKVPVYYLGTTASGARLFREYRSVEHATGSDVEVAVNQALGNTATDPDYRSGFPQGTKATVQVGSGTVSVDLRGESLATLPSGTSRGDAEMALNAIVYTADAVTQSQGGVRFEIDGQDADTVLGVPVGTSVERASADSVQSPVSVIDPAEGATVSSGFTVHGMAATFEANVSWELKQGDKVVRKGFTTAQECCTLSPYSFTVEAPPGHYTLVVHDDDPSSGEGPGITEDTKQITIK